jgi:hypothetical protein
VWGGRGMTAMEILAIYPPILVWGRVITEINRMKRK